ncbi:MAG TPA: hypothetical protein VK866_17120, partial [Acidimicrobiales bacterium]|nr:hypothetical protein [Acidimicrobiales bacterium]
MTERPGGPRLPYLVCVRSDDRDALLDALGAWGYDLAHLDGSAAVDGPSLWAAFADQLGVPDDIRPRGWDGFRDAAFEVLTTAGATRLALIWEHADALVAGDLQDLLEATSVLEHVMIDVRRNRGIEAIGVLLGDGPGYRSL